MRFLAGHAEELDLRLIDFNGAHCVTPSRVKPLRPLLSQLISRRPEISGEYLSGDPEKRAAEKEKNLALLLDSVANDKAA